MLVVGMVLAVLAALLHVYIFWMESVAWTSSSTRRVFGLSPAEAEATQEMAYNQGFYNLFLAVQVVVGVVVILSGAVGVGAALALAGAGSMLAAALVLVAKDANRAATAAKQGTLPLLAVVALMVGLLL